MNKPNESVLTVKMSEITLSPSGLDNIASEYYGVIPVAAGDGAQSNEISVYFHDLIHPVLKTTIKSAECMDEFMICLDSFRTKPL